MAQSPSNTPHLDKIKDLESSSSGDIKEICGAIIELQGLMRSIAEEEAAEAASKVVARAG
jgi:hypothetical protein